MLENKKWLENEKLLENEKSLNMKNRSKWKMAPTWRIREILLKNPTKIDLESTFYKQNREPLQLFDRLDKGGRQGWKTREHIETSRFLTSVNFQNIGQSKFFHTFERKQNASAWFFFNKNPV